jgi:hypothetical protein
MTVVALLFCLLIIVLALFKSLKNKKASKLLNYLLASLLVGVIDAAFIIIYSLTTACGIFYNADQDCTNIKPEWITLGVGLVAFTAATICSIIILVSLSRLKKPK